MAGSNNFSYVINFVANTGSATSGVNALASALTNVGNAANNASTGGLNGGQGTVPVPGGTGVSMPITQNVTGKDAISAFNLNVITKQAPYATNMIRRFQNAVAQTLAPMRAFADSSRYMTQGLSEIAMTLTAVIAPLVLLGKQGFDTAVQFEAAMVRVAKTTNMDLGSEQFKQLTMNIRNFAKVTLSSQTDLAGMVEQLGQLGVTDTNALTRLMQLSEKLAVSTDLSSDTVAESMGKIATAFGYDLNTETGVRNMEKLGDVINQLENDTAASAKEIVEGLLDVASVGGMLHAPIQEMAALVAMLVSMGVSSSEAGTRVNRFYTQIMGNAEGFYKLMQNYEIKDQNGNMVKMFKDADDVLKQMNTHPVEVLTAAIDALNNEDARAENLGKFFDYFGQRGGKMAVLAGNTVKVADAMKVANEQWAKGGSLQVEYDKALTTTEAHQKLLTNNLNEAGIIISGAVLPAINRLVEYAVPGIQYLTTAFQALSGQQQIMIVAIPLLVAAAIPLLLIFSQLAHGLSMIVMGFITFGRGISQVIVNIWSLAKWFKAVADGQKLVGFMGVLTKVGAGLGTVFSWLGLIVAALVYNLGLLWLSFNAGIRFGNALMNALLQIGIDIKTPIIALWKSIAGWGENLMQSLGDGILAGAAKFVLSAITYVANMVAGFFESHSPPKEGPLSEIDVWGANLIKTFLSSFSDVDFEMLSDVGNKIRGILQNVISDEEFPKVFANVREDLAKLIDIFNKTGQVSDALLSGITSRLGGMGGDVAKLIRLWLQYTKIQERLKQIDKDVKKADQEYNAEIKKIAASNMSAAQKAEAIRNAMVKHGNRVGDLQDEKDSLTDQSDALKEQLDLQKSLIDATTDQLDLYKQIADAMKKAADALSGALDTSKFDDALKKGNDLVKQAQDVANAAKTGFDRAKYNIGQFGAGFSGEPFANGMPQQGIDMWKQEDPQGYEEALNMYLMGQKAGQTWKDVQGTVTKIQDILSGKWITEAKTNFEGAMGSIGTWFSGIGTWFQGVPGAVQGALATGWQAVAAWWEGKKQEIGLWFQNLPFNAGVLTGELIAWISNAITGLSVQTALFVNQLLAQIYLFLHYGLPIFINVVGQWFRDVFLPALMQLGPMLISLASGDWTTAMQLAVGVIVAVFGDEIGKIVTNLPTILKNLGTELYNQIAAAIPKAVEATIALVNGIGKIIADFLHGLGIGITNVQQNWPKNNDGSNDYDGDPSTPYASGAVVWHRTKAFVGEGGPEAILPLSKLPSLMAEWMNLTGAMAPAQLAPITIQINHPVVREEQDIKKITKEVKTELERTANQQKRYRGG